MSPAMAFLLILASMAFTGLATWGLCTLTDDPPHHCAGCTCGRSHVRPIRPAQLYDYEQDPTHHTAS